MGFYLTKDKSGSSSVFLLIILAGIVSLTLTYVYFAERAAGTAYADAALYLSSRSVLAEYDKDLKDEYGIFAFSGSEHEVAEKIRWYADHSLAGIKEAKLSGVRVDFAGYDLMDTAVFQREINGYVAYAQARDLIKEGGINGWNGGELDLEKSGRILKNEKILNSLPSKGIDGNGSFWKSMATVLSDLDKVFEKGTANAATVLYIMTNFKNAQDQEVGRDTFFKYEAEYIVEGGTDDDQNRKDFRKHLKYLRNAANLVFLLADPVKMSEITAAAQAMTPGPLGLLTEVALAESWALAESENDLLLLEAGKKVPIFKTKITWATDLDSVLNASPSPDGKAYIDTGNLSGLGYQDYLFIFLFFEDNTVKVTRIMDLIQINMQGNYDRAFLIADHSCGFDLTAEINGRKHRYSHEY